MLGLDTVLVHVPACCIAKFESWVGGENIWVSLVCSSSASEMKFTLTPTLKPSAVNPTHGTARNYRHQDPQLGPGNLVRNLPKNSQAV